MLTIYEARSGALEPRKNPRRITEEAIWVDLLSPKREEETKVERALKLEVPTAKSSARSRCQAASTKKTAPTS